MSLADIAVIRRNGDSIWNGVLWGTIVGGAVLAAAVLLGAAVLWFHYGTAVFFEMIASGIAACF